MNILETVGKSYSELYAYNSETYFKIIKIEQLPKKILYS